jgi:hypothetical protein
VTLMQKAAAYDMLVQALRNISTQANVIQHDLPGFDPPSRNTIWIPDRKAWDELERLVYPI